MFALKIIGYGIEVACIIAQIMLLKTIIDFRKKRKKKEKNCAAKNEYFESISGDEERRHPYD